MSKSKGFAVGSGCYVCGVCGRKTRDVGDPSAADLRLCYECHEVAGIENEQSDWGDEDGKLQAEIDGLNQAAVDKGGVIEGYVASSETLGSKSGAPAVTVMVPAAEVVVAEGDEVYTARDLRHATRKVAKLKERLAKLEAELQAAEFVAFRINMVQYRDRRG